LIQIAREFEMKISETMFGKNHGKGFFSNGGRGKIPFEKAKRARTKGGDSFCPCSFFDISCKFQFRVMRLALLAVIVMI
jgi:hypothetical protein